MKKRMKEKSLSYISKSFVRRRTKIDSCVREQREEKERKRLVVRKGAHVYATLEKETKRSTA